MATPHTVSFEGNDNEATGVPPAGQNVPYETVITLPAAETLTKTGLAFEGWTEGSTTGTEYAAGASYTVHGNVTFYAKWESYTHTVTFDKGSGDTEADPTTKPVASPATTVGTLPAPPTKNSAGNRQYTFAGWNTRDQRQRPAL